MKNKDYLDLFFSEEQVEAIYKMMGSDCRRIFLSGKAGSGKSTTIQELCNRLLRNGKRFIYLGTTGISVMGKGYTIFQGLDITVHDLECCQLKVKATKEFEESDYVIIEESSMLSRKLLNALKHYLKQDQIVIFLGDLQQLPAVEIGSGSSDLERLEKQLFVITDGYVEPIMLWKVHRQEDEEFLKVLDKVIDSGFFPEINEFFSDEYRITGNLSKDKLRIARAIVDGIREGKAVCHIAATNAVCDEMNGYCQLMLETDVCREYSPICEDGEDYSNLPESKKESVKSLVEMHKKDSLKKLMKPITLYEGQKVIFTANESGGIEERRRYANGSRGTVVALYEDSVVVRMDDKHETVQVYYKEMEQTVYYDVRPGKKYAFNYATVKYLPLISGYSVTAHKCQGMTLDEAFIDPKDCREAGQFYTMLSRVKSREGVHLVREVKPENVVVNIHARAYYRYIRRRGRGYSGDEVQYLRGRFKAIREYQAAMEAAKAYLESEIPAFRNKAKKVTYDASVFGESLVEEIWRMQEFNELYNLDSDMKDPRLPYAIVELINQGDPNAIEELLDGDYEPILDPERYGLPLLERPVITLDLEDAVFERFVWEMANGKYEDNPEWDEYLDSYDTGWREKEEYCL